MARKKVTHNLKRGGVNPSVGEGEGTPEGNDVPEGEDTTDEEDAATGEDTTDEEDAAEDESENNKPDLQDITSSHRGRKKKEMPTVSTTVNIYEEDWLYIKRGSDRSASETIRDIIHEYMNTEKGKNLREKALKRIEEEFRKYVKG